MKRNYLSPAVATTELMPLLQYLRDSLAKRTDDAVMMLEEKELPTDPLGHAYLVRKFVCADLSNEQLLGLGFERVELAFASLLFRNEHYQVRVLKADHVRDPDNPDTVIRTLPVPATRRRSEFYEQPEFEYVFSSGSWLDDGPTKTNVIVLWDVDGAYQFVGFDLACPRKGGRSRSGVAHHWYVRDVLEHPASIIDDADDAIAEHELLPDLETPDTGLEQTGTDDTDGIR